MGQNTSDVAELVALLLASSTWIFPDMESKREFADQATRTLSEAPKGHGTNAGWDRHRKNGESPCQACFLAHHAALERRRKNYPSLPLQQIENAKRRYRGSALERNNQQQQEAFPVARHLSEQAAMERHGAAVTFSIRTDTSP